MPSCWLFSSISFQLIFFFSQTKTTRATRTDDIVTSVRPQDVYYDYAKTSGYGNIFAALVRIQMKKITFFFCLLNIMIHIVLSCLIFLEIGFNFFNPLYPILPHLLILLFLLLPPVQFFSVLAYVLGVVGDYQLSYWTDGKYCSCTCQQEK